MATQVDWIFPFTNVSWQFGTWIVGGGGPPGPGGTIIIQDEGIVVKPLCDTLNFIGGGVTATPSALNRANVTIPQNSITGIVHAVANIVMVAANDTIICDTVLGSTIQVELMDSVSDIGRTVRIKNNGLGFVQIVPHDPMTQSIEGLPEYWLYTPNEALVLQTDGLIWYIV